MKDLDPWKYQPLGVKFVSIFLPPQFSKVNSESPSSIHRLKEEISSTSSKDGVCYLIHVAADSSRNSDLGSATVAVLERRQEVNY